MDKKISYFFMSIITLSLIFVVSASSDLVFADKPEKDEKKELKEQREIERESAKEQREIEREEVKEFKKTIKINSSSSSSIGKDDSSSSSSIGKITICHIPPGNHDNAHNITVGKSAVVAHLAHGDHEGPCGAEDLNELDENIDKELRTSEKKSQKEINALKRAQKLIEKLDQQITKLNERLQRLMEKYQSGEYYGNLSITDDEINSYSISFKGIASSIFDESITTEMSGNLFLENQVTTSNSSKFKIVSGEIIVGNNVYDIAFGKARSSSVDGNSLTIITQTIDSQGNYNTIKINLGFESLEGNIGDFNEDFVILDNSKISQQWNLDGNGNFTES